MKHLLNNLSEEEKNSIRRQHKDVIEINTSRFHKLLEAKLGDSKPLLSEQELDRELPPSKKGILGHLDGWYDERDYQVNPDEFDYDEEIEFGPDDFEDYIAQTETDFPENKWSFNMKGRGGDRSPGKQYWDIYQKHGPIKLRRKTMK